MRDRVIRFGKTTRWFHWTFAALFLSLATTGTLLALREPLGLASSTVGDLVDLHKVLALGLFVLPALVLFSGDTVQTVRDLREVGRWTRDDRRWLALQPRALLGRAKLPPAGKLNAGQKLNALFIVLLTVGLALSGLLLWREPTALAAWALHLGCFVAWLPLFGGHLFLALVHPHTRPALRGMARGDVDRHWATEHHAAWVSEAEAVRPPGRETDAVPPRPLLERTRGFVDGEV